jgi:GNAT superfamily N-acetyltransferase
MRKYIFDEITLSQITREEFSEVEEMVYHALDSTMLDDTMLNALGYNFEGRPSEEERNALADDFFGENGTAFKILQNDRLIGGAFMTFTRESHKGELVLFGLEPTYQGRGLGQKVWRYIEEIYSDIEVWELLTPTAALINVDFYVNKCGFHIVEITKDSDFHKWGMFRFEKRRNW